MRFKFLVIMKLACVVMTAAFLQVSAVAYGQKITLSEKDAPLGKVFEIIEAQSGYHFLYTAQMLKGSDHVDINIRNASIEEVLDKVLKGSDLTYNISKSTVVLKKKADPGRPAIETADSVRGQVTDTTGAPLPGVSVMVKGTRNGVSTGIDGTYMLNDVPDSAVLVFSYVGFITQEVIVGNQRTIDVAMESDLAALDEVIVIGYGTQKKNDLTGAIASLKSEDFNEGVVTSVEQSLAGKIAGVQVVQNNAEPGGGIAVNIRGVGSVNSGTSPLYVIDGLPLDNGAAVSGSGSNFDQRTPRNPLASINPSDIESIEVLKDASATAIYGSRGANGVILITTKSGAKGALQVNYDFYTGVQNVANRLDVLSPDDYQRVLNSIIDDGGGAESERVTEVLGGGTDWQNEVYHDNALAQSHNLSFSGGNESTRFFVGLNYFDQDGVVKNSSFKRYGIRLNLEHDIDDNFKMGANINASYHVDEYIPSGFSINEGAGALYAAYNYDPVISPYNENGDYNRSTFMTMDNPLALLNGKRSMSHSYRTFGTVYAEYFFTPGFSARVNLGGDIKQQQRDTYIDQTTIDGLANGGIGTVLTGNRSNYLVEGLLNYNKSFENQSISAVVGATTQRFVSNNVNSTARDFPTDITETFNLGSGDPLLNTVGSLKASNQLLSYLGRINYSIFNKYLITASIRADGSSRFGTNNRFGYFPSVAGAWKLEEEAFFTSIRNTLNTFKVRASWGKTGNQEIGNYQSVTTFGNGPVTVIDGEQINTLEAERIGNSGLKWETTEQFNIGIDYGLWENRLYGSIDYYIKTTYDMLLNLPIPTSTGFSTQTRNVGKIENKGLEFGITSNNLQGKEFVWITNLNLSTLKNTVKDLGGIPRIITGSAGFSNQVSIIEDGLPLNSFYGYEIMGIWQEGDDFEQTADNVAPGDFKYRDIDGNGTVNSDDRMVLGNSFPDLIWSLGNTFTFKNFELYVFFEGQEGVSMYNGNLAETYFPISFRRNKFSVPLLNRWTPENPSDVYPSFVNPLGQGRKSVNNYTIEDASYVRLNTVKLSYRLNTIVTKLFRSATFYVTGQNLLTWTKYSGIDPAVNPNGGANFRIDFNAYPLARTFLGGVILQF